LHFSCLRLFIGKNHDLSKKMSETNILMKVKIDFLKNWYIHVLTQENHKISKTRQIKVVSRNNELVLSSIFFLMNSEKSPDTRHSQIQPNFQQTYQQCRLLQVDFLPATYGILGKYVFVMKKMILFLLRIFTFKDFLWLKNMI
jgi:hypothetical protein